MLLGGIAANQQDGRRGCNVAQAGGLALMSGEGAGKRRVIGTALVVDVVGLKNCSRKFLQQVVLFVCRLVGANHPNGYSRA